jgi:hypothetical protein
LAGPPPATPRAPPAPAAATPRARYDELTQREQLARACATLKTQGGCDPGKHGSGDTEPLTLAGYLEIIATGEVVARTYRHPVDVDRALAAGASWAQVAAARGCPEAQARQEYREWAQGQHNLWRGEYGAGGRFGVDDAEYAAAIARADELDPGEAKAYAATHRLLCAHAGDGLDAHWLAPGGAVHPRVGRAGAQPGRGYALTPDGEVDWDRGLGQDRARPGCRRQAGRWQRGPGRHAAVSGESR